MLATKAVPFSVDQSGVPPDVSVVLDEESGIYLLFQGLGTPDAARTAAKFGVAAFLEYLRERVGRGAGADPSTTVSIVDEAFQHTSQTLQGIAARNPEFYGLGAVASVLVSRGTKMVLAHVGHGRVYMKRGDAVHLLTREHTRAHELVRRGLLEPEEIRVSEHRLAVTRALGRDRGVQVDTILFDVLPSDTFFLCNAAVPESLDSVTDLEHALLEAAPDNTEGKLHELFELVRTRSELTPAAALVVASERGTPPVEEMRRREDVTLKIDVLKAMYLFEELSLEELLKVIELASVYDAKAGEAIVREGDIGEHLFVILDGETEVVAGSKRVGLLGSGNHFGEIAILIDRPRIATVKALRDTRLLVIPRGKFLALVRGDEEIGVKLLHRLAQELAHRLTQATELLG